MSTEAVSLYCATVDADCFAARLLLGALGVGYREVVVDVLPGTDVESRRALALAPGCSLPFLQVGQRLVAELVPVLLAIADTFDADRQQLERPADAARWLEFAIGPLRAATEAREASLSGRTDATAGSRQALLDVEDALAVRRLRGQRWIAGDRPTRPSVADFALYPAIALSRDFGLEHQEFPAIRRWLREVRVLAPSVAMPGILDPI